MPWPKKNSSKEFDNEKKFAVGVFVYYLFFVARTVPPKKLRRKREFQS